MEFFKIVNIKTSETTIQKHINFNNIEDLCESIVMLSPLTSNKAFIGGIWGEFTLQKDTVKGGLRFSLIECPNALAWTITTGYSPEKDKIVIHLTINRTQIKENFIEEIQDFLDDFEKGLLKNFTY